MKPNRNPKQKIQQYQEFALILFVPAAAIAIFSDNMIFETICFIAGITFGVLIWVERQL